MSQRLQRRGAPGPIELRRLRRGVFWMGRFVGLDTRAVVRFSEASTVRRWHRCGGTDLEQVLPDVVGIVSRRVMNLRSNG